MSPLSNQDAMTLQLRTDRVLIRARAHSTRYFTARIVAPAAPHRMERLPLNVAFVLDRSGSMSDARKFDLAREAVQQALGTLRETDRFSLVVYDNVIDVLTPSTSATSSARAQALAALATITPRASTNLTGGWLHGCGEVAAHLDRKSVSRCLLLTDGLANSGITNHSEIACHARELRQRGVITSTIGVGADFDERLLRDMAHEGGGNFYFVEGASQIPEILTSELGEAAEVTVRNAVLSVEVPRGAEVELLNRFRSRTSADARTLTVELGDLVSEQVLTAVFRVTFPAGEVGDSASARIALSHRHAAPRAEAGELVWRFASHAENDAQSRDRAVNREVAAIFAARARAEATEANRAGDFLTARHVLERTAQHIASYANGDAELIQMVEAVRDAVPEYARASMSAERLKASFFSAESALKSREPAGHARRTDR